MLKLRREAREPLVRRPTYEEMLREARTHRLKLLPERQRRTQQGILLDDVDFDDFDLGKHDRKEILSNNPEKGTQTDLFDKMYSTTTSESMKSLDKETIKSEEVESEPAQKQEPQREREEPQRERGKSMLRQVYDNLFGEDEYREEREEMRNIRQQIEEDEQEEPIEEQQIEVEIVEEDEEGLSMNVKKSYDASSSSSSSSRRSSTNRSALLPIEEEALSEHIQSSPPVTVQSSVRSDRTVEYVEDASSSSRGYRDPSPPQSVVSSRRSQETIEYIRSRSSRGSIRSLSS